jgi:hypothetical protein
MKKLIVIATSVILMSGTAYACKPRVVDVCPNIEGVQEFTPAGYEVKDKECVEIPKGEPVPPAPTPEPTPTPVAPPVAPPVVQNFTGK